MTCPATLVQRGEVREKGWREARPPITHEVGCSAHSPSINRTKHMSSGGRWGLGRGLEGPHIQKWGWGRSQLPQSPRDPLRCSTQRGVKSLRDGPWLLIRFAPLGAAWATRVGGVTGDVPVLAGGDVPTGSLSLPALAMLWQEERRWLTAVPSLFLHSLLLSYAASLGDVISTNVGVPGGGDGGRERLRGNPRLVSISATFYFTDHAAERFQV